MKIFRIDHHSCVAISLWSLATSIADHAVGETPRRMGMNHTHGYVIYRPVFLSRVYSDADHERTHIGRRQEETAARVQIDFSQQRVTKQGMHARSVTDDLRRVQSRV